MTSGTSSPSMSPTRGITNGETISAEDQSRSIPQSWPMENTVQSAESTLSGSEHVMTVSCSTSTLSQPAVLVSVCAYSPDCVSVSPYQR